MEPQIELTDDAIRACAIATGMRPSYDGATLRSVGHSGGMTVEDAISFARRVITADRSLAPLGAPIAPEYQDELDAMSAAAEKKWAELIRDAERFRFLMGVAMSKTTHLDLTGETPQEIAEAIDAAIAVWKNEQK
jgi:hypothetical protein